jgi:DNA repair exonuclease SbcCD ATPase subunit
MEELNKEVCPHCGIQHEPELEHLTELAERIVDGLIEKGFDIIWKDIKEEAKAMSRKDLAREMFFTGGVQTIVSYWNAMNHLTKEDLKENPL